MFRDAVRHYLRVLRLWMSLAIFPDLSVKANKICLPVRGFILTDWCERLLTEAAFHHNHQPLA